VLAPIQSQKREPRTVTMQRQHFAQSVVDRLKQINIDERWSHPRYVELEAEVEADGSQRGRGRFGRRRRGGLRRERSLGRALLGSSEQRILLQGDPGSGKSVALRHVAMELANRVIDAPTSAGPIGLYVSLKDLRPSADEISAEDVRAHVLRAHPVRYVQENLDSDAESGRWTFLFDSFDEIPEIMAAVEVDATVRRYEDAITAFLEDVRPCMGIVAAREYRGPSHVPWTRFRLLELSDRRRDELVERSGVGARARLLIETELPNAPSAIRNLSDNPMFLALLCEFVDHARRFPATTHEVFESYVDRCLNADEPDRVLGLTNREVRQVAQEIAFCMAADPGLGLSTELEPLTDSMLRHGFDPADARLRPAVEVLRRIRLARTDRVSTRLSGPPFSFAHRRFQEYFATCLVLAEPDRVPPATLLRNGRWRETAVTFLQLQSPEDAVGLVAEAQAILGAVDTTLPESDAAVGGDRWVWQNNVLHVLSILDAGLVVRTADDYRELRSTVGRILTAASKRGSLVDQKWVLDVIGPAPDDVLTAVLHDAFRSGSGWLSDAAFRQIGRLKPVPADIYPDVLLGLLTASFTGRLREHSLAISAQLERIGDRSLITAKRMLRRLLLVDLTAHLIAVIALVFNAFSQNGRSFEGAISWDWALLVAILTWSTLGLFCVRSSSYLSWSSESSIRALSLPRLRGARDAESAALALFLFSVLPRLLAVGIITNSLLDETSHFPFGQSIWVLWGLWLALLGWAPAALYAVRGGRLWYPAVYILPAFPVVCGVIAHAMKNFSAKVFLRRLIISLAGFALIVGTPVTLFFYAPAAIKAVLEVVVNTMLVLISLAASAALCVVIRDILGHVGDRKALSALAEKLPDQVAPDELIDMMAKSSQYLLLRSLRLLRASRALGRRADTAGVLADLLLLHRALVRDSKKKEGARKPGIRAGLTELRVELNRRWRKIPTTFVWPPVDSALLRAWTSDPAGKAEDRLRRFDVEIWDEIAMALADRDATDRSDESAAARPSAVSS
jgi:hypothetical protein